MKISKYIFLLSLILLMSNCQVNNGTNPPDTKAETLVKDGWQQFEAGNYASALGKFEEAIAIDSSYAEAYCGAGYSNARLTNLANSVSRFNHCISLNASQVDAQAGLAFVYNAQKQYSSAIASANKALSLNSAYLFIHDQTIGFKDLQLILAACYFAQGNFSQSLTFVKKLTPSFTANTNTYEGKAALAEEIERLRGIV
jgi:tetratricopeptide (TPR) repeat protein